MMINALLALALQASAAAAGFSDDFAEHRTKLWQLSAGGTGKAAVADGRLVLDMSQAKPGKWALADLHMAVPLPARIEWDQQLAHDSPHAYFAGLALMPGSGAAKASFTAGLGGGGLGRCVFAAHTRSHEGVVEPGKWHRMVLEMHATQQRLTVYRKGEAAALLKLDSWAAVGGGPFFIRFFLCDSRLGPKLPDAYAQDRFPPEDPARMAAVLRHVSKPCLGFKIMAASRNCTTEQSTRAAFQFAFDNLKPTDAVVVGMLQKHKNQVAENAAMVRELLADGPQ